MIIIIYGISVLWYTVYFWIDSEFKWNSQRRNSSGKKRLIKFVFLKINQGFRIFPDIFLKGEDNWKCFHWNLIKGIIKVRPPPSPNVGFIYFNENPLKLTKNSFYFTFKALFAYKIFQMSWLFWVLRKTTW